MAALSVASVAIGALGGGRVSIDHAPGFDHRLSGTQGAAIPAGVGLAGAAAQLATLWRRPRA